MGAMAEVPTIVEAVRQYSSNIAAAADTGCTASTTSCSASE